MLCGHVGAQRQAMESTQTQGGGKRRISGEAERGMRVTYGAGQGSFYGMGSHRSFFKESDDMVTFLWKSKALMVCWLVLCEVQKLCKMADI